MNTKNQISSFLNHINNLPELLDFWVKNKPNQKFLFKKIDDRWVGYEFKQILINVRKIVTFFKKKRLKKKDRVFILSNNRPEWVEFDIAIMTLGAITVPSFVTNNKSDNNFIVDDCDPRFIILENEEIYEKNKDIFAKFKKRIILIQDSSRFVSYNKIISNFKEDNTLSKVAGTDISSIIYTSGTTGNPKGVVLTHRSIIHNLIAASDLIGEFGLNNERFLSFLPLSHSYERMAGFYFPLAIGAEIFFCSSMDKLLIEIKEVKPTIISAVPRLYENVFKKIRSQAFRSGPLISFFLKSVLNYTKLDGNLNRLNNLFARLFINIFLKRELKRNFGNRIKVFISGGAALNPEIGIFFNKIGLTLLQGYGQTEASPLISCNKRLSNNPKTVGPPVKGVDVKISKEGEILVKGENVMQGYWKNSSLTNKTIKKGWLLTGDLGEIDQQGRIIITGRKKDLIITSGGDNISVQKIENMIMCSNDINQVLIYGDNRPYLIALIFLNERGEKDLVKKLILETNRKLNSVEKIRKFLIFENELTYEEGFLTQTLKVKRKKVFDYFENQINKLY